MKFLKCILSGTPYATIATQCDKRARGERRPLSRLFGGYWIIASANHVNIVFDKRLIGDALISGRSNGYPEIALALRHGLDNVL
jgi:hypothetical protein